MIYLNKLTVKQHIGGIVFIVGWIVLTLQIKLNVAAKELGIITGLLIVSTGLFLLFNKRRK